MTGCKLLNFMIREFLACPSQQPLRINWHGYRNDCERMAAKGPFSKSSRQATNSESYWSADVPPAHGESPLASRSDSAESVCFLSALVHRPLALRLRAPKKLGAHGSTTTSLYRGLPLGQEYPLSITRPTNTVRCINSILVGTAIVASVTKWIFCRKFCGAA